MGDVAFDTGLLALERHVLTMLLAGDDEVLAVLRRQFESASVTKRELTGVGFFTFFDVPLDLPITRCPKFDIGDVIATMQGLEFGAGFVLFVDNGRLNNLEGYCYEERWPKKVQDYVLAYHPGPTRDFDALRSKWSS